jgi:hypothetical protein
VTNTYTCIHLKVHLTMHDPSKLFQINSSSFQFLFRKKITIHALVVASICILQLKLQQCSWKNHCANMFWLRDAACSRLLLFYSSLPLIILILSNQMHKRQHGTFVAILKYFSTVVLLGIQKGWRLVKNKCSTIMFGGKMS